MFFYKKNSQQFLDLRGDLILTHNKNVIATRIKSAAPAAIHNARYINDIPRMSWYRKLKTTIAVIKFIWGKNHSLDKFVIDNELIHKKI